MNKAVLQLTLIIVLLCAGFLSSGQAQSPKPGVSFTVQPGFDGYAKSNTFTPVRITAANTGEAVTGELQLKTNYPGEIYTHPLSLPAQSQKEITVIAFLHGSNFTVEFVTETGKTLYLKDHTTRAIPPYGYLVGIVSVQPALLNFLAGLQSANSGDPLNVAHLSIADLPDKAAALAGLDALVFNDVDTTNLTIAQQNALAEWVRSGGQLVVGGGPGAQLTTIGLKSILPFDNLVLKTIPTLTGLGQYGNSPVPQQGPYIAALPQSVTGVVDLYEQNDPFLVRANQGRGRVSYFALDLGLAPMNGWAGNDRFWEKTLAPLTANQLFYTTNNAAGTFNDALANIPGAGLPSPGWMMFFLCSYTIILSPVTYLVLKHLKRQESAWIVLPVMIILFTLMGYIGGFRARGGEAQLRQISVVQQTAGVPQASINTFVGLYSPARTHYTLTFAEEVLVQPTQGGGTFNGVKTTESAPTTIYYGAATEFQNLWTDIGSMSTLLAQYQSPADPIDLAVTLTRQSGQWQVNGTITNHSNKPLQNAVLLIENYGVQLTDLPPGSTPLSHTLQTLDVDNYNSTTLWGESYYSLTDVQARIDDQIIRSVVWADTPPTSGLNLAAALQVTLVGWDRSGTPRTPITVTNGGVKQDSSTMIAVTGLLGER